MRILAIVESVTGAGKATTVASAGSGSGPAPSSWVPMTSTSAAPRLRTSGTVDAHGNATHQDDASSLEHRPQQIAVPGTIHT